MDKYTCRLLFNLGIKKTAMQEHFYSYMVAFLLPRLKVVSLNLLVFVNPYVESPKAVDFSLPQNTIMAAPDTAIIT